MASDGSSSGFTFEGNNAPTFYKDIAILKSEGWITADGVLAPEHDAAHAHWGGQWRMPTKQELDDLIAKCDWSPATMNGVNGYIVRGRDDYAPASIFLPCAAYGDRDFYPNIGYDGYYWSSVPDSDNEFALNICFFPDGPSSDRYRRYEGQSIRPVQNAAE